MKIQKKTIRLDESTVPLNMYDQENNARTAISMTREQKEIRKNYGNLNRRMGVTVV